MRMDSRVCCLSLRSLGAARRHVIPISLSYELYIDPVDTAFYLISRGDMDVGQVAFKNEKAEAVRRTKVKTRINDIVNRLNKTKVERFPDLQAEREAYDEGVRRAKKEAYRVAERERLEEERAREASIANRIPVKAELRGWGGANYERVGLNLWRLTTRASGIRNATAQPPVAGDHTLTSRP